MLGSHDRLHECTMAGVGGTNKGTHVPFVRCRLSPCEAPCRLHQSNPDPRQLRRAGSQARGATAVPRRLPAAAAAATSDRSTATATASGADVDAPLGTADLERFMSLQGITAAVVPPLNGGPLPLGCTEVKSLVFLAHTQPIVSGVGC